MSAMKALVALFAAVVAAVGPVLAVGPLDTMGWFNVLALGAGAVYVYISKNEPAGTWRAAKTFCSVVAALCVVLQSVWSGGITTSEWIQVIAAVAGAAGVFALPNRGSFGLV